MELGKNGDVSLHLRRYKSFVKRPKIVRMRLPIKKKTGLPIRLVKQTQSVNMVPNEHHLEEVFLIPPEHIQIKLKRMFKHHIQGHPPSLPRQSQLKKYIKARTLGQILKNRHNSSKILTIAQLLAYR